MKRINQKLALVLAVILLIGSLPMTVTAREEVRMSATYDNSLIVTVATDTEQTFTPESFPTLPVKWVRITEKLPTETGFTYEMVIAMSFPVLEEEYIQTVDPGQEYIDAFMENAMAELRANPMVTQVTRNRYADDYGEKASHIDLNRWGVLIPVGGQAQLYIEDKELVADCDNNAIGIQFEIDPAVFTDPVEEGTFRALGIQTFWALPDDLQTDDRGYLLYENYSPQYEWFDPSLKNAVSGENTYFGILVSGDEPREDYARAFHGVLHHLATTPGIKSVQLAYTYPAPTGIPPHEIWSSANNDVVSISLIDGVPADVYIDRGLQGQRVTLSGNSVGDATVTVTTGGGSVSRSTTCGVTVYQPGDTTMDGRVNAADALSALQYSVGKVTWHKESLEYIAGEVTGEGDINAVDALRMLQYAVGKLERFYEIPGGDWVKIDEVQFPDGMFFGYVITHYDTNQDGYLSGEEINAVKEMNLRGSGTDFTCDPGLSADPLHYNDLTGIGCFTALETLDCSGNFLYELDLAHNPNLKTLICTDTEIEHLDLRYNKQLTTLQTDEGVTTYGWVNQP